MPIKKLAERLGISRNTLYSRFRDPEVSYKFIAAVSNVVHYDFLIDFPELEEGVQVGKGAIDYCKRDTVELARPENRYMGLLERYTALLSILSKLANENDPEVRKEVHHFLDKNAV